MRTTRMLLLRLALLVTLVTAGRAGPVGAADPAQKCTRPKPEERAGTAVFRPGLNAHATKQKLTVHLDVSKCTPLSATGGAGVLSATFKPSAAQTCALINRAHALKGAGKLQWKNGQTSSLQLTFSLSGASRAIAVTGKVTGGQFAGRRVAGGFRYAPFASHHDTTVEQACSNRVAPNQPNRNSVVKMRLFRTKPFVIS